MVHFTNKEEKVVACMHVRYLAKKEKKRNGNLLRMLKPKVLFQLIFPSR